MNLSNLEQIVEKSYKQAQNWGLYKFLEMTILLVVLGAEYRLNRLND